ncbi:MAG: hypothetical protein OEV89_06545 [Desulfobulbaceae bacterium]|nr:hypothetical protein [Desulfobulbaceae bacterium]HIJ90409.1 hypothetical protein [Deltaproteobacteria bacterium]
MKKMIFILFCVVTSASNALAQTPSYMGRSCWNVTITDTTVENMPVPTTLVMTTDIVNMSETTYSLTGYVTNSGDSPAMYGGVGQIIGNTIYLSLTGSQAHLTGGWRDSSVFHGELSLSNLSGTFYEVGNDFNATTRASDNGRYTAGTISVATCP